MVTDVVNKVNGNDYYDYTKLKMPGSSDAAYDGENFSLAYQRAQENTDEKEQEKADKSDTDGESRQRTVVQGGVKLELSGNAQTHDRVINSGTRQSLPAGQGLIDTIRSWVSVFLKSVKELLYRIWNDSVPDHVSDRDAAEISDEHEKLTEEYLDIRNSGGLSTSDFGLNRQTERDEKQNEEIQNVLRSGNMEQIVNMVTENGQKTVAKNSTLLTYYDRTGKITPLSASDQERILHGDRNTTKL